MGRRRGSSLQGFAGLVVLGGLLWAVSWCSSPRTRSPSAEAPATRMPATEAADLWTDTPAWSGETATPRPTARPTMTSRLRTAAPTASAVPSPTSPPQPAAAKGANLRGGPGTNYPVLSGVKAGQALDIVAQTQRGDWYQLRTGEWIAAFLVAYAPSVPVAAVIPTAPPPPPATKAPPPPTPTQFFVERAPAPVDPYAGCCKVCRNSQACGNSCISWGKTCHKGSGCACQG